MPHLLKRLELNGFKSFAGRTVFEFPEGITAIVGPNGSGKSNIIDAVRWLLGERDAKNLRGSTSEDLIFGGTPKRPRLGQAQASLYFDNVNNFFPLDFSEIVVRREVSRDGSNRYYMNGSEVRLKDLVDFFAQARLGARGFVVVTQGNSDLFIRVSPRERREMIEEMLGLREYELKKSEAERRLKNTNINLDKVRALIEEILPHLRSLRRQTSRWEKRGALEEELRSLENSFFGTARAELERGIKETDAALAKKQEEARAFHAAREIAERELKKVEAAEPEERKELRDIKNKTRELLDEQSRLQKEAGKLEARLEMAGSGAAADATLPSRGALLALMKKLKTELGRLTYSDLGALEEKISALLMEIDAVFASAPASAAAGVPAASSRIPQESQVGVEVEFKKIKTALVESEKKIEELAERERHLEKSQEAFYASFKQAVAGVDAAKRRLEQCEAEEREIEFSRERLTLRLDEWSRQVEQAGRRPEEFTAGARAREVAPAGLEDAEARMFKLRGELAAIGEVDQALLKEAKETETRYEYLHRESADLEKARDDLRVLIADLTGKIHEEFDEALVKINRELQTFFALMFGGGHAELVRAKPRVPKAKREEEAREAAGGMPKPEEGIKDAVAVPEEAAEPEEGVEISVKLPKKRITSLEMLSGGERSLVGIAALFALISVSPPPFLVLDEVDAPLDERNAKRFAELLTQFSKETQFIIVTHNRATMETAHLLYGTTMNDDGTSNIVSLKLHEYAPAVAP